MSIGYLRKLPKAKQQKLALVCILTLIAVIGVIEFYVLQNMKALADTRDKIAKLNDEIRQAERKAFDAKQDLAHRTEVKTFVETQRATMVSGDPFAWVVREISLMAKHHPVRIDGIHPGEMAASGGKLKGQVYRTHLDIVGTYDQIGVFIQDLENRFPLAEVQAVSISGPANERGQYAASLGIALPVQPPDQPKPPAARRKA